jgi:hypothetical protein
VRWADGRDGQAFAPRKESLSFSRRPVGPTKTVAVGENDENEGRLTPLTLTRIATSFQTPPLLVLRFVRFIQP